MTRDMILIPQDSYEPRGLAARPWMKSSHGFTEAGCVGASLAAALEGRPAGWQLDGKDDPFFGQCGGKVSYHFVCPQNGHFYQQKWNQRMKKGVRLPITRSKVVRHVAEVLLAFIAELATKNGVPFSRNTAQFDGIPFNDIYLVELRQFGSSAQPILGRVCANEPMLPPNEPAPVAATQTPSGQSGYPLPYTPGAYSGFPTTSGAGEAMQSTAMPCSAFDADPFWFFGCGMSFDAVLYEWLLSDDGGGPIPGMTDITPAEDPLDLTSSFSRLSVELPFAEDYAYYDPDDTNAPT